MHLIKETLFIDEFQLGKLSGDNRNIDWNLYLNEYVNILRKFNKKFYIKKTLREAANKVQLYEHEKNMDYLNLEPFSKEELSQLKLVI